MDPATAAAVEEWPEVPFAGGYEGLHGLADQAFTGVVENAGATLYMLNGRVVGIEGGTVEDFESGGTAREGPHEALVLLYAMQFRENGDGTGEVEIRGQYYTEETPVEEVDRTLQQGGFTGYLELSENVLSGDYYVIYQGGKSTSVAFIGSSRRVLTDEEAFERACDEVGIYEVKAVDLDVIDIPDPPSPQNVPGEREAQGVLDGSGDTATVGGIGEGIGETTGGSGGREDSRERAPGAHDRTEIDAIRAELAERGNELDDVREMIATTRDEQDRLVTTVDRLEARLAELEGGTVSASGAAGAGAVESETDGPDLSVPESLSGTNLFVRYGTRSRPTLDDAFDDDVVADEVRENLRIEYHTRFENEHATVDGRNFEAWLTDRPEYRFVSWLTGELPFEIQATDSVSSMRKLVEAVPNLDRIALNPSTEVEADLGGGGSDAGGGAAGDREGLDADAVETGADAEGTGVDTGADAGGNGTDVIDEAGADADADETGADADADADETGPDADGPDADADADDTGADAEGNGTDTDGDGDGDGNESNGNDDRLSEGDSDVETDGGADRNDPATGDGDEEVEPFDLVAYDRMGRPLVVANMEPSREPVTEEAMASLVKDATGLATIDNNLAGAFFVTESYFEPAALSIADDATGGSLLGRDKRESFVKLSRNRGFHLCLVENREGSFHLTVPQL